MIIKLYNVNYILKNIYNYEKKSFFIINGHGAHGLLRA